MAILDDLRFFYTDLTALIVDYDTPRSWETTASTSWEQKGYPYRLLSFQQHVYLCTIQPSSVLVCNTRGEFIKENLSLKYPTGIDIDEKNSILFVASQTHVTLLNLKLAFLSSWKLPTKKRPFGWAPHREIKVDGNTLYLTIDLQHQVFLCSQNGKLLKEFGFVESGSKGGEFNAPSGLTVDNKYVYVCDCLNNRIQILRKENGISFSPWEPGTAIREQGQFYYPRSIYHHLSEDLIYVGDGLCVQLLSKDGVCLQRLYHATNDPIYGICVMDDRLYLSDSDNQRIRIFERSSE